MKALNKKEWEKFAIFSRARPVTPSGEYKQNIIDN